MRLKTDENIHPDGAVLLRQDGHDALTVWDEGLRGASDREVAETCRRENRVLVTMDLHFADITSYPPGEYAGLIVLRITDQSRGSVLDVLSRLARMLLSEHAGGKLWVVDEHRVRVRGG